MLGRPIDEFGGIQTGQIELGSIKPRSTARIPVVISR
jgi:hypothetical protein